MSEKQRSCFWMLCLVGAFIMAPLASANEDTCKPLTVASEKTLRTPSHSHYVQTMQSPTKAMVMLGLDKPAIVEQYNAGAKTYLFTPKDGKWTSMASAELSNAVFSSESKRQLQKTECSLVRMETVDGEPAVVFLSVTTNPSNTTKTWISQESGLVLRMEMDASVGVGTKTHVSMTYDYKNIALPPGAK